MASLVDLLRSYLLDVLYTHDWLVVIRICEEGSTHNTVRWHFGMILYSSAAGRTPDRADRPPIIFTLPLPRF